MVTLTRMPSAKPTTAPSAIAAPTLIRASLRSRRRPGHSPGTVEIGYAIAPAHFNRGYATAAVRSLLDLARAHPGIERLVANTPLDRPASGRVLAKAGFTLTGEADDQHDGRPLRVHRWNHPTLAGNRRPPV